VQVHDQADIKPTRQGILEAFEGHLIEQAKPGDVVVFHYSGHGFQVKDPEPINASPYTGTISPADTLDPQSGDIMSRSLFLLLSALETDNVTTILDSCYAAAGIRGRGRSVHTLNWSRNRLEPSEKHINKTVAGNLLTTALPRGHRGALQRPEKDQREWGTRTLCRSPAAIAGA
jgi:uncharacterized caspase-like protein